MVPTGKGEIVLYQTEDGRTRVECRFQDETIWLTQAAMAELFQTTTPNINTHLKNIYDEGELTEQATIKDYLIVRSEGARQVERQVKHYNLDAILAVGYRVRSQRGSQFRRWATELIKSRADHTLPNMGLTSWKSGEVRKTDVTIAKNYLNAEEIDELNRIVVMWLDFAEDQARRRKQVFVKDWEQRLDEFLHFNQRDVVTNAGRVTKAEADAFAEDEYHRFAERRRAFKEAQGEQDTLKALEDAARNLPTRAKRDDREEREKS